jgi:hypothetical protein
MTGFDLLIGLALGVTMVAFCAWFAELIKRDAAGPPFHKSDEKRC